MKNATETAKQMRNELKAAGVRARVQSGKSCGNDYVTVAVPSFDAEFTPTEIRAFCSIALEMGLTFVRGLPVNPDFQASLPHGKGAQWFFYL